MTHASRRAAIALACSFVLAGGAGIAGAQPLSSPATPQSAVLATGLAKVFASATLASSGTAQPAPASSDAGWNVGIYPVFLWIPTSIDIELELPPGEGGNAGSIIDGRFDGAYLGGFYASNGVFRVDADGVWAAVGGDRPSSPSLSVDVDLIYFHATGGLRIVPGFYATAGVRRLALKYNVRLAGFPEFERKPGIWDPVVGVGYHLEGEGKPFELHTTFEVGGFGAGADVEYGVMGRIDWKPIRHFGLSAGYSFLHYKFTDSVRDRDFTVKQSVHGPLVGIGLYF